MRAFLVALVVSLSARAVAYPFLPPRPVSSAIAGAADPHVAAAFYNPAALGPLRGLHLYLDGGARLHEGSIHRTDARAGSPSDATINWADFDSFIGFSWDVKTDSVTIALATYTPFVDLSSYAGRAVQYHERSQQFLSYEQTAAAAFKVSSRFYIGAAANFVESWLNYRYTRDVAPSGGSAFVNNANALCGGPCGLENPDAAQEIRLKGFGFGLGFSLGVLGRPIDRLWLGLAYTSHVFVTGKGTDLPLAAEKGAHVQPCGGPGYACTGDVTVTAALPDILHASVRVEATPHLDIEATARWVHYGTRSQLDVNVQGGDLARLQQSPNDPRALPKEFLLDRGLQDTFGLEVSTRHQVTDKLRLSPSLMFETSAVESSAVSAAAIDAPKLDVALTAEWHPVKHLLIGAHVGGTAYFLGDVSSRYNSNDLAACVDAHYSLDACRAVEHGYALPSSSGHYTMFVVHVGGAIGMDY